MNQKHMAGVTYMDRNQDDSSRTITTTGREKAYSPVWPSINSMGMKASMVVREEVSSGIESVRPVSMQARRRSSPRSSRLRMSSAMTIPLSTSMPRAMIEEAIETRSSSIPTRRITIKPVSMVRGTNEPTIRPVRTPRKTITTTSTMTMV